MEVIGKRYDTTNQRLLYTFQCEFPSPQAEPWDSDKHYSISHNPQTAINNPFLFLLFECHNYVRTHCCWQIHLCGLVRILKVVWAGSKDPLWQIHLCGLVRILRVIWAGPRGSTLTDSPVCSCQNTECRLGWPRGSTLTDSPVWSCQNPEGWLACPPRIHFDRCIRANCMLKRYQSQWYLLSLN